MELIGYVLLAVTVLVWLVIMLIGMIAAFPFGLIGLAAIIGVGLLLIKVIRDRLDNKEDDYYQKNIVK